MDFKQTITIIIILSLIVQLKKTVVNKLGLPHSDCLHSLSSADNFESPLVKRIINSGKKYIQQSCFSLYIRKRQSEICNCSVPVEYPVPGLLSCRKKKFIRCMNKVIIYIVIYCLKLFLQIL